MLRCLLALFVIGFAVWLIFAWSGYRRRYVMATEAWHRGPKNFIELTVVPDDRLNLDCASNVVFGDMRCGFGADHRPSQPVPSDRQRLRPYNTVNGELLLGAGLWSSPRLPNPLPAQRFTVWCDYDLVGAVRSAALRWSSTGPFTPLDRSVMVGRLHDCATPP